MAAAFRDAFGCDPQLIAGGGGEFEVVVDGKLVYSKRATGTFPAEATLLASLRTR